LTFVALALLTLALAGFVARPGQLEVAIGSLILTACFLYVGIRLGRGDAELGQDRMAAWGAVCVVLAVTGWNAGAWALGDTAIGQAVAALLFIAVPSILVRLFTRRRTEDRAG
jgi:hypothetical protein